MKQAPTWEEFLIDLEKYIDEFYSLHATVDQDNPDTIMINLYKPYSMSLLHIIEVPESLEKEYDFISEALGKWLHRYGLRAIHERLKGEMLTNHLLQEINFHLEQFEVQYEELVGMTVKNTIKAFYGIEPYAYRLYNLMTSDPRFSYKYYPYNKDISPEIRKRYQSFPQTIPDIMLCRAPNTKKE